MMLLKPYEEMVKSHLIRCLVEEHQFSQSEAEEAVNTSVYNTLLKTNPEFVYHYNVEDLAEEIKDEYQKRYLVTVS